MKIKISLIVLTICFILFLQPVGFVKAQDIDVEAMSNEELMVLLQSIIQKLDKNESTEVPQKNAGETEIVNSADTAVPAAEPEASEPLDVPVPTAEPEAAAEKKTFEIYENKKLIIGRMPDSYFIRKENGDGKDNDDGGDDGFDGGYGWEWDDDGGDDIIYYPWPGGTYDIPVLDNYITGKR